MRGLLLLFACGVAFAQAGRLEFEVATVKIVLPEQAVLPTGIRGGPGTADPVRATYGSITLKTLLTNAYSIDPNQLSGPDWIGTNRFDIEVKIPEGATKEQVRVMLQNLLADRFKVTLHHDTKDLPFYELTVAKGGPKLKAAAATADAPVVGAPSGPQAMVVNKDGSSELAPGARGIIMTMGGRGLRMVAGAQSMAQFAERLSSGGMLDGAVVDKTGLAGTYDFSIEFTTQRLGAGPSSTDGPSTPTGGTSLAAALQEQLGLKLEKKMGPTDVIVVDGAEKQPTAN